MSERSAAERFAAVHREILARAPEHDLVPSLDRIAAVVQLLGDPQHAYPAVHLTGTNGKTSTTRMVERLLREHGLRTGRFTSPHLADVRERISWTACRCRWSGSSRSTTRWCRIWSWSTPAALPGADLG